MENCFFALKLSKSETKILFAAIIFPPEDEIIYLFRKLESKKKKQFLKCLNLLYKLDTPRS